MLPRGISVSPWARCLIHRPRPTLPRIVIGGWGRDHESGKRCQEGVKKCLDEQKRFTQRRKGRKLRVPDTLPSGSIGALAVVKGGCILYPHVAVPRVSKGSVRGMCV